MTQNVPKDTAARGDGMAVATITHPDDTELDVVRSWRFEELLRAGYDEQDAIELAFHIEIDLHWATSLVARGCPSETAARIAL